MFEAGMQEPQCVNVFSCSTPTPPEKTTTLDCPEDPTKSPIFVITGLIGLFPHPGTQSPLRITNMSGWIQATPFWRTRPRTTQPGLGSRELSATDCWTLLFGPPPLGGG